MILGDCPSDSDVRVGKNFSGGVNRELTNLCRDAGFRIENCWISNVSKYHVRPNPKSKGVGKKVPFDIRAAQSGVDLPQQLAELQEEINQLKPNCILALSSSALWALTGKTKIESWRGSILHGMGTKLVSTYHPQDLLFSANATEFTGYYNRQIMVCDFRRAYKQSQFPELELPRRRLEICQNSAHLAEFLKTYIDHTYVSVDIESLGNGLPGCVGLAFTRGHGICVPLWNMAGMCSIPDADMVQIWYILDKIFRTYKVIGQNFNYDRDKMKRLGFIFPKYCEDTMMKAQAINPELPKGLAFNTSIYTEEPFYKDEGMYEGSWQDLMTGCARDACVTYELWEEQDKDLDEIGQRPYYKHALMQLPDFYWRIEQQGFTINEITRDQLIRKYIAWDENLRYKLFKLTGTEINVNSPKQIALLLFENFKLPHKSSTGEEAITELLNSPKLTDEDIRETLELILEDRRVRKSIGTYLMALPDYDGKMRTTYFPCLDTGRSSTGKQDPPIRPKIEVIDEDGKKKKKALGIAFQTMTKHGDVGEDIRSMYVPDSDDEIFIQADSSQAEARVVWLLANDEEALRLVDEIDYHAHTAVWFFGPNKTLHNYDKRKLGYEHPIRFVGKTLRHAGHLGAGKRRASISVNTDARKFKIPINISEAIAERALKIFHAKQPKIQQVFQQGIIDCLKKNRTLIAPVPYGLDEVEYGGRRTFYERYGEELFREGFAYIPQRTVTDNTKFAGIRILNRIRDIKIIMESHDSLLFAAKKTRVEEYSIIIKEEFERPIRFNKCSIPRRDLVIPCEIETGTDYQNLSKYKFMTPVVTDTKPLKLAPKSVTEQFTVVNLPGDTRLDNVIYEHQQRKFEV